MHVCRQWRNAVFSSPSRLDLRLGFRDRTPVREMLEIWPPLPIAIWVNGRDRWPMDNIVAALEHNDRICQSNLWSIPTWQWEKVLPAMQRPFPTLRRLHIWLVPSKNKAASVAPASFLGGFTPHLQSLRLWSIPFPGLPTLLLSATHLVDLNLQTIPHSGYFSPEAMVTALSVLINLEKLLIEFESSQSRPDQRSQCLPPPTRTLLPVLIQLQFLGASECLEDLIAWIDAPLLVKLSITFFQQLIFNTPQLTEFISRTPKFKARDTDTARVVFSR